MIITSTRAKIAAIGAALLLPLSVAACNAPQAGGAAAPAAPPTSSAPSSTMPSESPSMSGDQPFGAGCAAVPKTGKGSFDGMSADPVATAASNNPALSTLVTAVKAAGLVDTLNTAKDITVFAPSNDAFKEVPPATLKAALADPKGLLTEVLTAHVVAGKLSPDQLAGEHQSLNKSQ